MSKKNLILGGILIVLVAFAWIWSGPLKDWKKIKSEEKSFLAGVSASQIDKIIIEKNGQNVELDKDADSWKIAGVDKFGTDKTAAGALNTALSEIGSLPLSLISNNADKKSSFGTDKKGMKVEIVERGKTIDMIVGSTTADHVGTYISQSGSDKTYEIALDLNSIIGRDEWRDSTIFSFLKERAEKIRFQYALPKSEFAVEMSNNKWTGIAPKKFNVSSDKVNAVLSVLENLSAAKIPAQTFANTGLEKHSIIIQITGEGFDNTLMIGDCTKDDLCYAKTGASDNIYLINKADRDALDKKSTDLK
jgi:hypothetical protein